MKYKSILPSLIWLQLIMLVVIFVYLIRLQIDVNIALRKIELARVVASGRTRQDVIQRLGKPDFYEKGIFTNEKISYSLMTYRDDMFNNVKLNGNETIVILLNEDDQIVTTYFESPSDKINLERRIRSR